MLPLPLPHAELCAAGPLAEWARSVVTDAISTQALLDAPEIIAPPLVHILSNLYRMYLNDTDTTTNTYSSHLDEELYGWVMIAPHSQCLFSVPLSH